MKDPELGFFYNPPWWLLWSHQWAHQHVQVSSSAFVLAHEKTIIDTHCLPIVLFCQNLPMTCFLTLASRGNKCKLPGRIICTASPLTYTSSRLKAFCLTILNDSLLLLWRPVGWDEGPQALATPWQPLALEWGFKDLWWHLHRHKQSSVAAFINVSIATFWQDQQSR